ncbi:MAG: hypothetical protein HYR49_10645 [Gammaproteobacteria bacterium]|nr:hypothetical protein [Gammaproteobacteria bacterium]
MTSLINASLHQSVVPLAAAAAVFMGSMLISGCSINGIGLIAGRVNQGEGAVTYTTFAPGINVRTGIADRGLSVGYTRRLCLADDSEESGDRGWYFFKLPADPPRCYARDLYTAGAEIRLTPVEASVALGLRETTVLAQVPDRASVAYEVSYDSADPDSAFLRLFTSGAPQ